MIKIKNNINIKEKKIIYLAIKSTGPGGQNINKVSTAIILKYKISYEDYPAWFIKRLKIKAGKKYSKNDHVQLRSKKHRSQLKNKKEALNRLILLFFSAAKRKQTRKRKRKSQSSIENRLRLKRMKSIKKRTRSQKFDNFRLNNN
tara:strand:- start:36070 stop:36504 length:435 start_codon:yes stop_codon:yes gene_type:complete